MYSPWGTYFDDGGAWDRKLADLAWERLLDEIESESYYVGE